MTLELRCGDVVQGCDGVVTGETREEVLDLAAAHARDAHGMDQVDDATGRALAGAIHPI